MHRYRPGALAAVLAVVSSWGCANREAATAPEDAAFEALQARGEHAMGVNQHTSTHRFDALADGGRIELQRDVEDPEGVATIRAHLSALAEAFASGDLAVPAFVHAREVPGAPSMAALSDRIEYAYHDLPRGGEIRLVTSDPEAVRAIHEFMAFQREEHRAGGAGHTPRDHAPGDAGTAHSIMRALHDGHGRGSDTH